MSGYDVDLACFRVRGAGVLSSPVTMADNRPPSRRSINISAPGRSPIRKMILKMYPVNPSKLRESICDKRLWTGVVVSQVPDVLRLRISTAYLIESLSQGTIFGCQIRDFLPARPLVATDRGSVQRIAVIDDGDGLQGLAEVDEGAVGGRGTTRPVVGVSEYDDGAVTDPEAVYRFACQGLSPEEIARALDCP